MNFVVNDSALIKAKEKDPEAVLALIEAFKPLMVSMGRRYNFENRPAEDYLQEGIVVLLEAVDRFDFNRDVPFAAFLKDQMFYHFVGEAKKFHYTDSLDLPISDEEGLVLLDVLPFFDCGFEQVIITEHLAILKICLNHLRPRQRWLIREYYFKKRSLRDLARAVKLSANSLSQYHCRTLKKLKALLEEAGIDWTDTPYT